MLEMSGSLLTTVPAWVCLLLLAGQEPGASSSSDTVARPDTGDTGVEVVSLLVSILL